MLEVMTLCYHCFMFLLHQLFIFVVNAKCKASIILKDLLLVKGSKHDNSAFGHTCDGCSSSVCRGAGSSV